MPFSHSYRQQRNHQSNNHSAHRGDWAFVSLAVQAQQSAFQKSDRLLSSFHYAWEGWKYAVKTQRNIKIHIMMSVLAMSAGVGLSITISEWAMLFAVMTLVMMAELFNTSVEIVIDMITGGRFDLRAKAAKDVAAAAVLITALGAIGVGCFIFLPHLRGLL